MNSRPSILRRAAALALASLAVACGRAGAPAEPAGPLLGPTDPAVAATLTGRIVYDGPAPERAAISMDSDPACVAHASTAEATGLVVGSAGELQSAVVWIREGLPAGHYAPPHAPVTIDQDGCQYRPRVVALMVGQPIEITNRDATTHNVHLAAERNRAWNRSQFAGAIAIRETFDHEEISIPIGCNVHPWMKAWAAVVRHPYFAVSAADGTYRIEGIPPGDYTIAAWHEKLGTIEQHVVLSPRAEAAADFTFRPSGRA